MERVFANRGIGATLCRPWRRDEPPPPSSRLDAGAKAARPSGRSSGQEHVAEARPPRLRPARPRPRRARGACPRSAPATAPMDHAIASWVYTGVMWVGSAMCLLAAATRRRERGAWALIGLGLLLWSGGDLVWTLWLGNLENPPYPSVADGLYLGSYVAIYAGLLRAAARAPAPHPPRAVARRRGGRPGRRRGRRRARLPRAGRDHRGRHDRRRLQPRLSGLRRPAAHAHRHGLRPQPLARGPLVAAAGPRAAGQRRRRLGLQLPVGRRHLRRGLVGRHAVAPRAPC